VRLSPSAAHRATLSLPRAAGPACAAQRPFLRRREHAAPSLHSLSLPLSPAGGWISARPSERAATSTVRGPKSVVGGAPHTGGGVWGSRLRSPVDLWR
jgi:hypothetical protein